MSAGDYYYNSYGGTITTATVPITGTITTTTWTNPTIASFTTSTDTTAYGTGYTVSANGWYDTAEGQQSLGGSQPFGVFMTPHEVEQLKAEMKEEARRELLAEMFSAAPPSTARKIRLRDIN